MADRAPGVSPSLLEKIFEPFFRAEEGEQVHGVGLGLAIARRAMQMHNGSVTASPREGGGLLVKLILPSSQGASAPFE
ncbi:signal transduction histidine kinase [Variovorax boronicumulans]|nr:signal transduction histidine kinase [Variovorax boronicumulans]